MAEHSILVRRAGSGESWSEPERSAYTNELHLQELLADDPDRIPGVSEGAAAVRELQTSAGPIDICVVEPSGAITVVECKLSTNSEKRRMVIGQVIDYAAGIRADGVDLFRHNWAQKNGRDLDEFLGPDAFSELSENIEAGRINLCLAVDRIDPDLRRLIEYLNLVSRDEVSVTALELTYARHGEIEILIPATFGTELAESKRTKTKPDSWTWDEFIAALVDPADREFAEAIHRRAEETPAVGDHLWLWCGWKPRGAIYIYPSRQRYGPIRLWIDSAGQLRIFGNWRTWPNLNNDERFAALAAMLGQSHLDGSRGASASELDLDEFWRVVLECDSAINLPYSNNDK